MTAPAPAPGQAAYEAVQDHAEWAGWAEAQGYRATGTEYDLIEMASAFKAGMQAARDLDDATLAAEVRAGHVRIETEAPQPAPELATGPCPFDGHDGEHLRLNTHGHWLCAINLTNMLVAADVITDLQPGQAACDLARARQGLRDLADVHDALLEEILRNAGEDMDLTGTPEDRAARYVRSLEAGRTQERPAPGAVPDLLPGRMDKLDRIAGMCRRPAEVAGRSSGSGIVSGTNLAAAILHVIEEES